jgi:hypothetical protein
VLANVVVAGYASLEAAQRDYGVVIRYVGEPDALVRPPADNEDRSPDDAPAARRG